MSTVKKTAGIWQRWLTAITVLSVSMASIAQSERVPLPDMGNSANSILTEKEEAQYANALIRQMRAYDVLVDDPLIRAYFENMGFQLVAQSDRPEKPFHFVVLNQSQINAFAAPGGIVALHSGLILAAENEHEVAGVLAHEVAHITQLHLYRAFESSQRMSIPIALAMLGLILAGGGGGDAISGALMGGQAMAQQMQINFTRANEYEADRIGISTLSMAGFDPQGMAGFFSKLSRITRVNGEGPPEFLRTHPVTTNRIAEAQNRAQSMPKVAPKSELEFFVVQARVRALLTDKPVEAITYFRDQLAKGYEKDRQTGLKYGLAIALQRHTEYEEAEAILQSLLQADPNNLSFQLQLTDLQLELGQDEAALETLGGLYHSFPGNHAIAMQYSKALLARQDPHRAETASVILRQQILFHEEDPVLFALYARSADIAGDQVRATEAIAESYYYRGGVREAIEQLDRLDKQGDLDYYQRARISARLLEMRVEMAEMRDNDRNSKDES